MKSIDSKFKVLILLILICIITFVFLILNGNKYIVKFSIIGDSSNLNDYDITIDDENIVKIIDKKIENEKIKIKIESKSQGKTYINITEREKGYTNIYSIYVHKFGIITFNEYMGDFNGSILIPISVTILLSYILVLLIKSYKQSMKTNMYQYKNIAYLGIIVFLSFSIINQFFSLYNYGGLINTINNLLHLFSFAIVLFPITFIVSILVIISNISLIRKEGFNLRNILGIFLGSLLCFFTILPDLMYNSLYFANWIDIHNQNGLGVYIYNLVESIINIGITYIECVLIGTIIMGIKSAKHIPTFDKDAIIILGCKIKNDGTLTNLLKGRADRAIEFSKLQKNKTNKDILFIPSGGKGDDETISEAQAIKNYLLQQGITEDSIIIEDKSKNTYENIKFSNNIIKEKIENAKIVFSTTNYHVFRAGCIASKQSLIYEGIGSKTKLYFWINAFIREFIATLNNERKKHFAVLISILFITIIMIIITYLNNNV